jgi:plasmid segregation protein ParM
MMTGTADIHEDYLRIIKKEIEAYCKRIYDVISEQGYNLKTMHITFVGGGAVVMKRFGERHQNNIVFVEDVKANAKGFELLGNMFLKRNIGKCLE